MVNRVFYYSKDVAAKYGNRGTFLKLALIVSCWIILSLIIFYLMFKFPDWTFLFVLFVIFCICALFFGKKMIDKIKASTSAWAMTEDGHLYKVVCNKMGQGLPLLTTAIGGMIDSKYDDNSTGKTVGTIVGAAATVSFYKRAEKYMSTPEIVAKFVEERNNNIGAIIYELLKVNSIKEYNDKIIIKCDYKISYNSKIKYNGKVVLLKVYNKVEDLIETIKNYNLKEK